MNFKDYLKESRSTKLVNTKLDNLDRMKNVKIPSPEERRAKMAKKQEPEEKHEITYSLHQDNSGDHYAKVYHNGKHVADTPYVKTQREAHSHGKWAIDHYNTDEGKKELKEESKLVESEVGKFYSRNTSGRVGKIVHKNREGSIITIKYNGSDGKEKEYPTDIFHKYHTPFNRNESEEYLDENLEYEHIQNELAKKDINSKIENGQVVVHKDNLMKASVHVKKLGCKLKVISGLNEDTLDEERAESPTKGTRKIAAYGDHAHTAEVRYNSEWQEYQVHHYKNGKHQGEGPVSYHGDDKEDAHDTAKYSVKLKESLDITEDNTVSHALNLKNYMHDAKRTNNPHIALKYVENLRKQYGNDYSKEVYKRAQGMMNEELDEANVYDPLTKKMVKSKPIKSQAGGGVRLNGQDAEWDGKEWKNKKDPSKEWYNGEWIPRRNESEEINLEEMSGGMEARDLHRVLKSKGWELDRTGGGHDVFKHPKSRNNIAVPRHRGELARPTVLQILKKATITEDQIVSFKDFINQD